MRINQYLAACGVASRRKSEELILAGKVSVNGQIVCDLSFRVDKAHDVVVCQGNTLSLTTQKEYYMLHKPKGVISAAISKYKEPTVVDLVDSDARLFPVGRLDKDTTGLILLTNDGDLAYKMTHPKFEKSKTYEALVHGHLVQKDMDALRGGVVLEGKRTAPAKLRLICKKKENSLFEITLTEGRKRQVRNMFRSVGHRVLELKRTKECGLELGALQEGEWRPLKAWEIKKLKEEVK